MAHSRFPAFFELNYHSSWGQHSAEFCTLDYSRSGGGFDSGAFENWNEEAVEADVMVNALVTALKPFYPSSVVFDNYTIYTLASDTADPLPKYSASITSGAGTAVDPGWSKAVQFTTTYRGDNFTIGKIVMLDVNSGDNFSKQNVPDGLSDFTAIMAVLSDEDNAFSTRGNGRPETYLSTTKTLNEKLRRQYGDT